MTEMTGALEDETARTTVVPPHMGLPGRLDMRRAFDIYVFGRNRALGPEEKGAVVGGAAEVLFAGPAGGSWASTPAIRRPAVRVPDELRYDRGAGTWRRSEVAPEE